MRSIFHDVLGPNCSSAILILAGALVAFLAIPLWRAGLYAIRMAEGLGMRYDHVA